MVKKLSIIIISKNEEKYLPRLLESIKNQTYRDYEVILSDAHSIDNTRKIAKKYGCKIVDGGLPSVGRNNGAKHAKGKMLLFLDSDVELPNDFLEKSIDEMKRKKWLCGSPYINILSNNLIDRLFFLIYNVWIFFISFLFPQVVGSCIFCNKSLFNKVKGFNPDILFAEDADFVKRLGKYDKFRILSSSKISLDPRRIKKEGRIKFAYIAVSSAIYRVFFGEIKDLYFKYELQGGVELKNKKR